MRGSVGNYQEENAAFEALIIVVALKTFSNNWFKIKGIKFVCLKGDRIACVSLTPHVGRISLLRLHLLDVLLSLVVAHVAFRLYDVEQDISHVSCHILSVTTNKLPNQLMIHSKKTVELTRRCISDLCCLR